MQFIKSIRGKFRCATKIKTATKFPQWLGTGNLLDLRLFLPTQDRTSAKAGRSKPLLRDKVLKRRTLSSMFEKPRLVIETLERAKLLLMPKPGALHRRFMTRIVSSYTLRGTE